VEIVTTIYGGARIIYGGIRHGLPALARWLGRGSAGISDDAARIARGHAWGKHGHEFPEFENADEFAEHIDSVVRKPTAERSLSRGRHAYYDESTNTVVIKDPKNPDGGTAFRPGRGREYFEGLE